MSVGALAGFFLIPLYKIPEIQPQNQEQIHCPIMNSEFYQAQIEKYPSSAQNENIKGLIVNHHLLASNLIAEALSISPIKNTIVLISPDHFYQTRQSIYSATSTWLGPDYSLKTDKDLISNLQAADIIMVKNEIFKQEHGIGNPACFITYYFPNAKLIPLIINSRMTAEKSKELAKKIIDYLPKDVLIVASLDFVHELPDEIAKIKDSATIDILNKFKQNRINEVEVDSRPALNFFLDLMQFSGAKKFHLIKNTNSFEISNINKESVVSYITAYYAK